jgi:hypothetical protein
MRTTNRPIPRCPPMNVHLHGPKGHPIPRCPPMNVHLHGPKKHKDQPIPRCPPMDFFEIRKK